MKIFRQEPGVSLILAMIYMAVAMIVAVDVVEINLAIYRGIKEWDSSAQAEDLAEGASWLGRLAAEEHGPGWSVGEGEDPVIQEDIVGAAGDMGVTNCAKKACGGVKVIGRGEKLLKLPNSSSPEQEYSSVPAAFKEPRWGKITGSGDAASECGADPSSADDPCHWNQLKFGEVAEVPLFYDDDDDDANNALTVLNANHSGAFKLRIRTPRCERGEVGCWNVGMPGTEDFRVLLYPATAAQGGQAQEKDAVGNIKQDPVLMHWIVADKETGAALLAAEGRDIDDRDKRKIFSGSSAISQINLQTENTEITGSRINHFAPDGFVVLERSHKGKDLDLNSANNPTIGAFLYNAKKPVLRLNLISIPFWSGNRKRVPYLEWQLLTEEPVSDTKSTIIGWARINDFRQDVWVEKKRKHSVTSFVLESL